MPVHSLTKKNKESGLIFLFCSTYPRDHKACLLSKLPSLGADLDVAFACHLCVEPPAETHPEKDLNFPAGCFSTSFAPSASKVLCFLVEEKDSPRIWVLRPHRSLVQLHLIWMGSREAPTSCGCLVKVDMELRYAGSSPEISLLFQCPVGRL